MTIRPELRTELLALPSQEREALADELYDSVSPEVDPAWEAAWASEFEHRIDDVVNDRVELLDADDVHGELRAELGVDRR